MATRVTEPRSYFGVSHLSRGEFLSWCLKEKGRTKYFIFDDGPKRVKKAAWEERGGRITELVFEDKIHGAHVSTHLRSIQKAKRQPSRKTGNFIVFQFNFDGHGHQRRLVETLEEAEALHDQYVAEAQNRLRKKVEVFQALGLRALPLEYDMMYEEYSFRVIREWLAEHSPEAELREFHAIGVYVMFPTIEDALLFKLNFSDAVVPVSGAFEK